MRVPSCHFFQDSFPRFYRSLLFLFHLVELTAEIPVLPVIPVGHDPVVTDSHIPGRHNMQKRPPDKLMGSDGHLPLFVSTGVILPFKGNSIILHRQNAMIRQGDAMSIAE